jgi:hypothetical protein
MSEPLVRYSTNTWLAKHRDRLGEAKNGREFKVLLYDSSPDERKLALKIINEIERAEKRPLTYLDKSRAENYVKQLGGIRLPRTSMTMT